MTALRFEPPPFGSPMNMLVTNFVARTTRSRFFRSCARCSPMIASECPFVYPFAVSMKLPPRST
jgi:hypothetical protein